MLSGFELYPRWVPLNLAGFFCVLRNWRNKFYYTTFWASSISSIGFHIFHDLLLVLLELFWYEALTHGTKFTFSSLNSTFAAFCFDFCCEFACILAFSFELCVDVASLEVTFGCFDCFVPRLFPLLCLPFAVVFSSRWGSSTEIEISVIRIAVGRLQFLLKNWYII